MAAFVRRHGDDLRGCWAWLSAPVISTLWSARGQHRADLHHAACTAPRSTTSLGERARPVPTPSSLADDVQATGRVLDRQDGPAILVGHSWGGTIITEAGVHDKVAGLVYVSALAPDAGETTAQQYTGFAPTP